MAEVRVVREPVDLAVAAFLLDAFNTEYDEPTPGAQVLAERLAALVDAGTASVLLADDAGVAVIRFRPALWTWGQEAELAELYVVPRHRGAGLGRRLLHAALEEAGAKAARTICLSTGEHDTAARALYESEGFFSRDGDGCAYFYEREL